MSEEKQQPGTAEWVVGVLCALVVLAGVGYLFHQALSRPSGPPLIRVQEQGTVPAGDGFLVEIRAWNDGASTASNVMIEGAVMRDDTVVERSSVTLDFVPAGAHRDGGLFFTVDPRRLQLRLRPAGYQRP